MSKLARVLTAGLMASWAAGAARGEPVDPS